MADVLPEVAPSKNHQTFKLVDARTGTEDAKSEGGCGCGGHGNGGGCGCGGKGRDHEAPVEETTSGCGCGGHGHKAEEAKPEDGCGCGGKGRGRGGHGRGHHGHGAGVEELVLHSIPKVVRRAALFAAMDSLPVGENIQIRAPHQPDPLFAHLQESESHYRVETIEAGPENWRYRITRIS